MSNIIEIYDLTKKYQDCVALNNLTLTIPEGKIVGLLGPNGSGKTTLIKILANLLMNYSGNVLICDKKPGLQTKSLVSYLPDKNFISDKWTTTDAINYFADFFEDFDKEKAISLAKDLGLEFNKRFKTLSKGTKDKLQLILVLSRNAKVYLLDEPIAGVDPAARDYIFKLILGNHRPDSTIIISTHLIMDAENIIEYAVFLKKGELVKFGDKEEIYKETNLNLNEYFKEVYQW